MGGSGSGNHYHWHRPGKKTVVESCLSIEANRWGREGILKPDIFRAGWWRWTYRSGTGFTVNYEVRTLDMAVPEVRLTYSWTWDGSGEPQSADYLVRLTTTRPRFGGLRWWLVCPLVVDGRTCNRRVGKLYLPPRARHFGCRHCHGLTYTSSQESHKYDGLYRLLAREIGEDVRTVKRAMDLIGRHRSG